MRSADLIHRVVHACGLELRIELDEPDLAEIASIRRNLALTPTERLDQLVRTVRFARTGQAALSQRER